MTKKTTEELIAEFESEYIDFHSMLIDVEGHDEPLEYSKHMDDIPQRVHIVLPEYSTYSLTIKYKVKKRPLKNLTYHQCVKKHGIPMKTRNIQMADEAQVNTNDNPYHTITFQPDALPGGRFIRGTYPATSTFHEDGNPIFSYDWIIEITNKHKKPEKGGY